MESLAMGNINDDRLVLCRPGGGLNDMLCQIEQCCRYAELFHRKVIVETDHPQAITFRDNLSKYFRSISDILFLKRGTLDEFGKFDDIFPHCVAGRLYTYHATRDRVAHNIVDSETLTPLLFDVTCDYRERVLLRQSNGGGLSSFYALRRLRLTPDIANILMTRRARLGSRYVGLHIRNTDLQADYKNSVRALVNEVDGPYFVATDNRESLHFCQKILGEERVFSFAKLPEKAGKVLHRPGNGIDEWEANSDAIVDLLLLALSEKCYTFSITNTTLKKKESGFSRLATKLQSQPDVLSSIFRDTPAEHIMSTTF